MKLNSSTLLKEIMAAYFHELAEAAEDPGQKVAWCTSAGPAEILRAFGYKVYFPENHGAALGASRQAGECIPSATALGYSSMICSYLTSDIGAFERKQSPLACAYGLDLPPRPDLLVACDNQCREVEEWFSYYSRAFSVPLHVVRTPKFLDEIGAHHLSFVEREFALLVEHLEQLTGRALDRDALAECVDLSAQASRLWHSCLNAARNRPSPFTFWDGTIHMAPIVLMRGSAVAVRYYQALALELEEQVRLGNAAVAGEKFRLYWEGMPIWGRLRSLSETFAAMKAAVVASTYCNSWAFQAFDGQAPLPSLARGYVEIFINRSESYKEEYLVQICRDFAIDGIIYHDAKTCPYNSNTHFGLPDRVQLRNSLPYVTIDGDLNDLRCYSDEQAQIKFETFMELLEQSA